MFGRLHDAFNTRMQPTQKFPSYCLLWDRSWKPANVGDAFNARGQRNFKMYSLEKMAFWDEMLRQEL